MAILHTFASLQLCRLPRNIFEKAGKLAAQQHMGEPSKRKGSNSTRKLNNCELKLLPGGANPDCN
jgi:hypothetical protein